MAIVLALVILLDECWPWPNLLVGWDDDPNGGDENWASDFWSLAPLLLKPSISGTIQIVRLIRVLERLRPVRMSDTHNPISYE